MWGQKLTRRTRANVAVGEEREREPFPATAICSLFLSLSIIDLFLVLCAVLYCNSAFTRKANAETDAMSITRGWKTRAKRKKKKEKEIKYLDLRGEDDGVSRYLMCILGLGPQKKKKKKKKKKRGRIY